MSEPITRIGDYWDSITTTDVMTGKHEIQVFAESNEDFCRRLTAAEAGCLVGSPAGRRSRVELLSWREKP